MPPKYNHSTYRTKMHRRLAAVGMLLLTITSLWSFLGALKNMAARLRQSPTSRLVAVSIHNNNTHHKMYPDPLASNNDSMTITSHVPNTDYFFAHNNHNNATDATLVVSKTDWIMTKQSPLVLEEYQLIFFPVTKVACTAFKMLLRRMQGLSDWNQTIKGLHSTKRNGLVPLHWFSPSQARHMMTAPDWTRAIFVRDPKERLLSAYLDKAVHNSWYVKGRCCSTTTGSRSSGNRSSGNRSSSSSNNTALRMNQTDAARENLLCLNKATGSLQGFLDTIQTCLDMHWVPQTYRMDRKYWKYINFVGHLENGTADTQRLLQNLGVWEKFGASGWGPHGNLSFLDPAASAGRDHATNAVQSMKQHYTSLAVEQAAEAYYRIDYDNPYLGLSRKRIFDDWI